MNKDLGGVKKAIKAGADVDTRSRTEMTPLIIATIGDNYEIIEFLLEKGAEISLRDKWGKTALSYAVNRKEKKEDPEPTQRGDIVKLLADHADEKSRELSDAVTDEDLEGIITLTGHGVHVDAINSSGETPLMIAVDQQVLNSLVLLLKRGADVNAQDNDGNTALVRAIAKEKDDEGNTALIKAMAGGKLNLIDYYLIGNGADVNIQNEKGVTALMHAAGRGYSGMVEYLIKKRADVRLKTEKTGFTALMYAVHFDNPDKPKIHREYLKIVDILISEGGANPIEKAKNGKTPRMIAQEAGNTDMVQKLEEWGAFV